MSGEYRKMDADPIDCTVSQINNSTFSFQENKYELMSFAYELSYIPISNIKYSEKCKHTTIIKIFVLMNINIGTPLTIMVWICNYNWTICFI